MKLNIRRLYDGKDCPVEFEWNFVNEDSARQTLDRIMAKDTINFNECAGLIVECSTFDGKRITADEFSDLIRGEYWYLFQFMRLVAGRFGKNFFA